jgi:hypothetical protein
MGICRTRLASSPIGDAIIYTDAIIFVVDSDIVDFTLQGKIA